MWKSGGKRTQAKVNTKSSNRNGRKSGKSQKPVESTPDPDTEPNAQVDKAAQNPAKRAYKKAWEKEEQFMGWLQENNRKKRKPNEKDAWCKVCEEDLRPHKTDLARHGSTQIHNENMNKFNPRIQQQLENLGVSVLSNESKTVDLCLAMHIACHSAIRSVDHLVAILNKFGKGSPFGKTRLHRTKCSKLIVNVLAPALLTQLVNEIKNCQTGYSLIIDESTDLSCHKYLGVCVRFYNQRLQAIVTDFLGFIEVTTATADILSKAIKEYLAQLGINIKKMVGLGTDGASVMVGRHHSVYTLLKEEVPNLQLVRCICHSLHLCASKASNELPSDLEFLVRESRNWFVLSPTRIEDYTNLYKLINEGKVNQKLVTLSKTRWLAWSDAVTVILKQWLELKTLFTTFTKEKCKLSSELKRIYNDPKNYLYLRFLKPILQEINRVNILFQSSSAEVSYLFGELRILLMSLVKRIVKPAYLRDVNQHTLRKEDLDRIEDALRTDAAILPIHIADFGKPFEDACAELGESSNGALAVEVKKCLLRYLVVLCREIVQRLPTNLPLFEAIRHLAPGECCNSTGHRPKFADLPIRLAGEDANLEEMEVQWNKLPYIPWGRMFDEGEIPSNSEEFWKTVYGYTDAGGRRVFKDIATFAMKMLSLPHSNAVVERVFSIMNAIRTKPRNRLSSKMLESIMRIRIHSSIENKCCEEFIPTQEMMTLFTSKMYDSPKENKEPTNEQELAEVNAMEEMIDFLEKEEAQAEFPMFVCECT